MRVHRTATVNVPNTDRSDNPRQRPCTHAEHQALAELSYAEWLDATIPMDESEDQEVAEVCARIGLIHFPRRTAAMVDGRHVGEDGLSYGDCKRCFLSTGKRFTFTHAVRQ